LNSVSPLIDQQPLIGSLKTMSGNFSIPLVGPTSPFTDIQCKTADHLLSFGQDSWEMAYLSVAQSFIPVIASHWIAYNNRFSA